ncbi:MAG: hypothetical protein GTN89_07540 [Acidobacteria bacterium]|nr:hypothetical protein [Acidobacteriota bacterium]NIM63614.1 hypothetical protein [Acidobacteriota bacterium]NIO59184.1 hypothetical protein [Acidobacteriota bacterium]NIQ30211.1 hypothetical protein [Acidobacteriota bacterium]NIQ85139.1 hypothetical protein [Acidobacteriota bacterium]
MPVFFDEMTALFVHREARPDEAASHALQALDVRGDLFQQVASMTGENLQAATREIDRMLGVDPEGGLLNLLAASVRLRAGDTQAAETHAVAAVRQLRGSPRAHATLADVRATQREWREAAASYREAIERSPETARPGIYRKLARCYTQLEQHGRAYSAMRNAVDAVSSDAKPADLYELALSARRAGEESDARQYLRFADLQTPPGNNEWRRRIDEALRAGGSE